MKSASFIQISLLLLLIVAPFFYLYASWEKLPAQVPLHWGFDGKPNRTGSKNELAFAILAILSLGAAAYFLLANADKIDPKNSAVISKPALQKMGLGIFVFLSAISIFIIHNSIIRETNIDKSFFVLLGLFFAYLGNIMHSLKPNYFAGVRTPWALENEENWRKTHQMSSKLWVACGALIIISALIFPMEINLGLFVATVMAMLFYPVFYSYQLFRNAKSA